MSGSDCGAFLTDFARELGDEAPLAATITRTLNIFTAAGVPPEQWSDLLYQARGLTQEHTAQIRKLAGDGGDGIRRKNKMPYFFATLEQLVGLRPAPVTPPPPRHATYPGEQRFLGWGRGRSGTKGICWLRVGPGPGAAA